MCLAAFALQRSARFPLVLAANRDEFHGRATAPLGWWDSLERAGPLVLGGRDLAGGGTWFGLNARGRWALLTNIRSPHAPDRNAPSRGTIVTDWLAGRERIDKFWMRVGMSGFNGFNLVAGECRPGLATDKLSQTGAWQWDCHWFSSQSNMSRRLDRGVFGVSNGMLDEPWPKLTHLTQCVANRMAAHRGVNDIAQGLFLDLGDRFIPADTALPATGVPLAIERQLAATFVHMPERDYGTRSSLVLIAERTASRLTVHLFERQFDGSMRMTGNRYARLRGWPLAASAPEELPPGWDVVIG